MKKIARARAETIRIINRHWEKKLDIKPISGLNLSRMVKVIRTTERIKHIFAKINFRIFKGLCFFIGHLLLF